MLVNLKQKEKQINCNIYLADLLKTILTKFAVI